MSFDKVQDRNYLVMINVSQKAVLYAKSFSKLIVMANIQVKYTCSKLFYMFVLSKFHSIILWLTDWAAEID